MSDKPFVVFDTNALISAAILPLSVSGRCFGIAPQHFQLVTSPSILKELFEVIHRPRLDRYFNLINKRSRFFSTLSTTARIIDPSISVNICRDPKDDMVLNLALAAKAQFIVSGDADLRVLNPFRGIQILSPSEFLQHLTVCPNHGCQL